MRSWRQEKLNIECSYGNLNTQHSTLNFQFSRNVQLGNFNIQGETSLIILVWIRPSNFVRLSGSVGFTQFNIHSLSWYSVKYHSLALINAEYEPKELHLGERLVKYSCQVMDVVEVLPGTKAANYIAAQLVRCGPAPAHLWWSTKFQVKRGLHS